MFVGIYIAEEFSRFSVQLSVVEAVIVVLTVCADASYYHQNPAEGDHAFESKRTPNSCLYCPAQQRRKAVAGVYISKDVVAPDDTEFLESKSGHNRSHCTFTHHGKGHNDEVSVFILHRLLNKQQAQNLIQKQHRIDFPEW